MPLSFCARAGVDPLGLKPSLGCFCRCSDFPAGRRWPCSGHCRLLRSFFVEVLRAVYRPSKESGIEEPPPADAERRRAIASQAYELLRDWRRVPGLTDAGMLDPAALEAWVRWVRWVREARVLCAHAEAVGDLHCTSGRSWPRRQPNGADLVGDRRQRSDRKHAKPRARTRHTDGRAQQQRPYLAGVTDGGLQERERAAH
jgi:hypothetical protein